jgi:HAD superfamily hydrolase (TIGR01549 family)
MCTGSFLIWATRWSTRRRQPTVVFGGWSIRSNATAGAVRSTRCGSAFQEASREFAPRLVIAAIEKLIKDPECRRAVATEAPYSKDLEAPYDGAEQVLRALSSSYKIGVIANQSVGSTDRLTKWGLMPFISVCLCSSELGLEKPDPAVFELALDRAGCCPNEAVMIGDRLDNDIRPARLLGWNTIRVAQGFARFQSPRDRWDEPDLTVESVNLVTPVFIRDF